ncbi:MAG: putative toxin-antitoxin system toxin component, PIN family [Muribaculaceae bacterium]|nr:putative toxin-antitoxin system toxin component, PIN family [Muribaculaceae bacterium]
MKTYHAVIDTNVIVAALLTTNQQSATVKVVDALLKGIVKPLYNEEILAEYDDVLRRAKFHFTPATIDYLINEIRQRGINAERVNSDEYFPDPKDVVFYEVALSKDDAYLVTGNVKHFPHTTIVVTPTEMMAILAADDEEDPTIKG